MKYKIDKYVIEANSPVEAFKAMKIITDSAVIDGRKIALDDDLIKVYLNGEEVFKGYAEDWIDDNFYKYFKWTGSQYESTNKYGKWIVKVIDSVKVVKNGKSPKDSVKDAFAIYNANKNKYLTYTGWGNKNDSDIQLFESESYAENIKNAYYNQAHIKVVRVHDNDLDYLTEEEEKAVDDYRQAINGTNNPKLLKLYQHILEEELEHIEELTSAEITEDACKTKDADSDVKQKALRFLELLKQSINSEMWQIVANDAYSLIDMLKRNKLAK